jgi:hypothetical protein
VNAPPGKGAEGDAGAELAVRNAEAPAWALTLARLMDEAFVIPVLNVRVGLDAILGLVAPGVGDAVAASSGLVLVGLGFVMRVPGVVLLRMALNVGIDALIGAIPLVGDVFDVAWRANSRNVALIERFARPGTKATTGDYIFATASCALIATVLLLPLFLLAWIVSLWVR